MLINYGLNNSRSSNNKDKHNTNNNDNNNNNNNNNNTYYYYYYYNIDLKSNHIKSKRERFSLLKAFGDCVENNWLLRDERGVGLQINLWSREDSSEARCATGDCCSAGAKQLDVFTIL